MQNIAKCILWLINQRIWISLGAVGLLVFSYRVAGVSVSSSLTVLVFLGTWFVYGMQQKFSRLRWFAPSSPIPLLAENGAWMALLISMLGIWILINRPVLVWLWGFSMPAVFYAMGLSVRGRKLNGLRSLPRVKIILIAVVWTAIATLPWVQWEHYQEFETWVYAAMVFCFITILTIPFDVRDKQFDQVSMKTMGQTMDIFQNQWVMVVLALIASRGAYFLWQHHIISVTTLTLFLSVQVFSLVFALYATGKRSIWIFEFALDGMLILLGLSYWLY